jgi:predicted nucleic acid-binding protein
VFVDTGAWFALQVTDDRHHRRAREALPKLLAGFKTLVTTNHVIGETYTLLRMAKGYAQARKFLEVLDSSPRIERYFISPELERETYALLHRHSDHPFSFVDGTSFAVMRKEGMQYAFAFDAHFAAAGFVCVPGQ